MNFVEPQSEISHGDHNEIEYYQIQIADESHQQQLNELSHEDDFAQLFPGSDLHDNTLAAMGGAMQDDVPYIDHSAWSMQLDGVLEGSLPASSYTEHSSQYYMLASDHQLGSIDSEGEAPPTPLYGIQDAEDAPSCANTIQPRATAYQLRFDNHHQCPSCYKSHRRGCDLKYDHTITTCCKNNNNLTPSSLPSYYQQQQSHQY